MFQFSYLREVRRRTFWRRLISLAKHRWSSYSAAVHTCRQCTWPRRFQREAVRQRMSAPRTQRPRRHQLCQPCRNCASQLQAPSRHWLVRARQLERNSRRKKYSFGWFRSPTERWHRLQHLCPPCLNASCQFRTPSGLRMALQRPLHRDSRRSRSTVTLRCCRGGSGKPAARHGQMGIATSCGGALAASRC